MSAGAGDPIVGRVLSGTYRIEARLGAGGMGAVYAARHVRTGKAYAVKVLLPEIAARTSALDRFRREAHALAALGHAHIVAIHDFDQTPEGLALWRGGMRALSERPNVCAKLSGPHMFLRNWTVESYRPLFAETIELFGPGRCMIASNVPPDATVIGFDEIYRRFYELAAPYSEAARRAMFHDTAARFYRL